MQPKTQYMERFIMQDLIAWKNREDRKPLILLGARQVGKTYILKEFGQREFENVAYINCDNNAMAKDLFASDYNIDRILLTIGAITGVNIEAGKTLIIMDEIQELHRGLASLKYFCENAREYHVAVAGSLLGLSLHQGESYPVGKVNTLEMYPMTFEVANPYWRQPYLGQPYLQGSILKTEKWLMIVPYHHSQVITSYTSPHNTSDTPQK